MALIMIYSEKGQHFHFDHKCKRTIAFYLGGHLRTIGVDSLITKSIFKFVQQVNLSNFSSHLKIDNCWQFNIYEHDKFHAQGNRA